ncbi:Dimethylamine corrinoid protein 2 [Desulfosporosinus sp. I2]|uniref:corrinoid protein n=1 Tax=Desulfosporosinus sp. I2 TaxID=1617025 RepID=UPI0005ED9CE6|nr:corrinoid protein [Desulfosporosinus sp. I2]KJR45401.1 Dimethylamine corrinoid protein 2 [Desulfosporosinus sp. I2]
MSDLKQTLLLQLADSVVNMDEKMTVELAQTYIENNFNPYEGINKGLAHGMDRAGELYEEEEYFIPELLMCSDAMYAGLDVLRPHLKLDKLGDNYKVVIGVVEGDTHDIGKNLVKIMLETSGFDVVDLGRDVPPLNFVKKAKEISADIIALSTLMTTTMEGMKAVIQLLERDKLQDKIKVMIGGGPISKSFADKIGAHYAEDASKAAKLAQDLVQEAQQ